MYTKKINPNLQKLITILNDGHFHTGDEIGEKLNITRAAIWKSTEKLADYGIAIQSVKSKGYALSEPLLLLDSKKIKLTLSEKIINLIDLEILETTPSTNEQLKNITKKSPFTIVLSEQQTQGKGRLGRNWHSPFGQNIYFSCHYRFQKDVSKLAGLSLVVALATINALHKFQSKNRFAIKWPNDILVDAKKLAGILIEINAEAHGLADVIMGVGINCNMLHIKPDHIDAPWTSLRQISGEFADRNELVAALITYVVDYIQKFEVSGLSPFITEWRKYDYLSGKTITVANGNAKELTGVATGIDKQGHLLLKLDNGNIQTFSSGDTTLRKKRK
jgi:BirA family transcriptional regulator, biotin operon repressor / biotin---[acetyl-CoA-carboxylase] ligase